MTKSNFGKYFRYKLSKGKPFVIIFAVLNFLSITLPCIRLYNLFNYLKTVNEDYDFGYIDNTLDSIYTLIKAMIIICIIVITVTTAKSMKFYHNRAAVDMLGSLPLSYGERFWGDLLSSICVNFISFVPFSIISLILTKDLILINDTESLYRIIPTSDYYLLETIEKSKMIFYYVFILIFVYIGIYAVTTFISSCCGKFGSSVFFSIIAMSVIPGIYTIYANWFFSNVIGVDASKGIISNIFMLPPLGPIFSVIMRLENPNVLYTQKYDLSYLKQPICIMASVVIIAAFIAGAFFIGKKRKAEKTGQEFVFKTVFHILSLTLLVMIIGVIYFNFFEKKGLTGILMVLLISFLFYIILELSQNKSFKGFWKAVIRFAAGFGACIAFLMIAKTTNFFNYYKKLPSENNIKEVKISGAYFYSIINSADETKHIYKEKESVSVILSEHKKLLMSDGLKTGNELSITYVTKNGSEFTRGYSIKNDSEPIKSFSGVINDLEEFDPSILGVLNNSDFSGIKAVFSRRNSEDNMPYGIIRNDKINELAELLRFDIKNNYFYNSVTGNGSIGILEFIDENGYYSTLGYYGIFTEYKDTLEFLNNPDNYVKQGDNSSASNNPGDDNSAIYDIDYMTNGDEGLLTDISISISEDDTSEYAKELMSYIEVKNSPDEYSPKIWVSGKNSSIVYGVRLENEKAAIKAMLKLFREKYVQ